MHNAQPDRKEEQEQEFNTQHPSGFSLEQADTLQSLELPAILFLLREQLKVNGATSCKKEQATNEEAREKHNGQQLF